MVLFQNNTLIITCIHFTCLKLKSSIQLLNPPSVHKTQIYHGIYVEILILNSVHFAYLLSFHELNENIHTALISALHED